MEKVAKENDVHTTVENSVLESESKSEELYERLKKEILEDIQRAEEAGLEDRRRRLER